MKFMALLLVFGLASCACIHSPEENLSAAVAQVTKTSSSHYQHALVDLNGDNIKDAIVLLLDSGWCGSGGCTMLVFEGCDVGYVFISRSTVTRKPIRISNLKNHGWKNIIVNSDSAERVLRFDGQTYPLNPSVQPEAALKHIKSAQTVIPRA